MLGILFNLITGEISVPPDKFKRHQADPMVVGHQTKKEVQQLAGKLQFAATCVRPGRVFIGRLYDAISELPEDEATQCQWTWKRTYCGGTPFWNNTMEYL